MHRVLRSNEVTYGAAPDTERGRGGRFRCENDTRKENDGDALR